MDATEKTGLLQDTTMIEDGYKATRTGEDGIEDDVSPGERYDRGESNENVVQGGSDYDDYDEDEGDDVLSRLSDDITMFSSSRRGGGSSASELWQLVTVAAATAATLGYDVGIMAAAIQPIEAQMNLTGVQKEVAMGSLNFFAAAGALLGGHVADREGRKKTIQLCAWIFVLGTLLMALAPNYTILLLGRIVTGVGVGVSFVVAPVFISEVAPTDQRGALNTVFDVAINGGIVLGYIVGFLVQIAPFIEDESKWRLMLGMGLVLPIIVLASLAPLPESPRWLMLATQKPAAIEVLTRLGNSEEEVNEIVDGIETELRQEEQIKKHVAQAKEREAQQVTASSSFWEKVRYFNPSPGKRLAIGLGFWQQITGTESILYFSADFLARAGLDSLSKRLFGNVFIGFSKLIPELIAMQNVDNVGRRPLLITSSICLTFFTAALSFTFWAGLSPTYVVVLLCCVVASFSFGLGPYTFLCVSENLALSERASGTTIAAAVNRCTSGAVALTTVSMYEWLGDSGFFGFYALVGLVSLIFYVQVPETSGASLEELSQRARSVQQSEHNSYANADVELMSENRRMGTMT